MFTGSRHIRRSRGYIVKSLGLCGVLAFVALLGAGCGSADATGDWTFTVPLSTEDPQEDPLFDGDEITIDMRLTQTEGGSLSGTGSAVYGGSDDIDDYEFEILEGSVSEDGSVDFVMAGQQEVISSSYTELAFVGEMNGSSMEGTVEGPFETYEDGDNGAGSVELFVDGQFSASRQ